MLFVLRLAPFCTAFSTISPCVQHQNTLHFAPKRTAFCGILHCVQQHIALYFAPNSPKRGVNDGFLELIFILPHSLASSFFASKQTFARIDFLRRGERLVDKKGTHNVKFLTKNQIKNNYSVCTRMSNGDGKHVHLRPPARAVAGHANYGLRGQHHENAEVICH